MSNKHQKLPDVFPPKHLPAAAKKSQQTINIYDSVWITINRFFEQERLMHQAHAHIDTAVPTKTAWIRAVITDAVYTRLMPYIQNEDQKQ